MKIKNQDLVDTLLGDINEISGNLRYSAGIQLVYTALLLNKYLDLVVSKFNLNGARIRVLYTLILHGGSLKPKDLCKLLFQSKQSTSSIIEILLKNGLVSKQIDPNDRRSFIIVITRKGLDAARASIPIMFEAINSVTGNMSESDNQLFNSALKDIRKNTYRQLERLRS